MANEDPDRYGCSLLDPTLDRDAARGFPVCEATPAIDLDGYAGALGWIQLVRSTDASGAFELDPLSLFRDVASPFAFFGIKPTLFDAPFRESRFDLSWTAHTFLSAVPDAVMSKTVSAVAAFSWGFELTDGLVTIQAATALDDAAWNEHLPLLRAEFPSWRFV